MRSGSCAGRGKPDSRHGRCDACDACDAAQRRNPRTDAAGGASKGATALAVDAFSKGGLKALLSGATPRFMKRSLQTALVWTMYEELLPIITKLSSSKG